MRIPMRIMSVTGVMVILGLVLVGSVVLRSNPVQASPVAVSINAPAEVVKGSSFTVSVDIGSVTAFDAGQFDVSFNESLVGLDNVTAGQIGATQIPVDLWNKMGTGTYRIIVNVPGVPGVSGAGTLAVLHFHAAGSAVGTTAVNLSNGFLNDNLAMEIPATWTGDSVIVVNSLVINTTSLPNGKAGSAYSTTLAASGGSGSYTWSLLSGSLPSGITLNAAGTITGTPTMPGAFTFTVQATDGHLSDSKSLSIQVAPKSGDANADGAINSADITKVERIIVGLDSGTPGADANGDGVINSADITCVERYIVGLG